MTWTVSGTPHDLGNLHIAMLQKQLIDIILGFLLNILYIPSGYLLHSHGKFHHF